MNRPSSERTTQEIMALEDAYASGVYPKRPLAIVRGRGAHVWDADGREYVDCVGGHGAANVGHGHPAIVEAINQQSKRLLLCPEIFYNDRRAEISERLIELAPPGLRSVFFCNSGTEAVEGALKFARIATGRSEFVAAMRGFHGRTFGALSATWEKRYRVPFEPVVPGFSHVPYNEADALAVAVTDTTAAVLLEVIQGEGGVRMGDAEYLQRAQELCRERGSLLIIDEVQTGLGRTGRMFACEHSGIEPDLLVLAKSLGGGLPIGAVLASSRIGRLPARSHGSTFGGNPLVCAAADATLEVLERERLPQRAADLGTLFTALLRKIDSALIREVRGAGLMVGVELKVRVTPVLQKLAQRGILALPAGPTVVRFLPPLVIDQSDLELTAEAFTSALDDVGEGDHPPSGR